MITDLLQPTEFRYEKKFLLSTVNRYQVESVIKRHPAIFSEIYHQRFVNNIYFDTLNMDNYWENEFGVGLRVKTRIRWYGDLFGAIPEPVLQFKIKNGFAGSKLSYPLKPFTLDSSFTADSLMSLIRSSELPALIKEELLLMQPTLLNHYSRKYFQSANHKYRLTIDWDMEFYALDRKYNTFYKKIEDFYNIVLELKYSDSDDNMADIITGHLPFRISKSSKYVRGIDYLG